MSNSKIEYKLDRLTKALCSGSVQTRKVAGEHLCDLLITESDQIDALEFIKLIHKNVINFQSSTNSDTKAHKYGLCICAMVLIHSNIPNLLTNKKMSQLIQGIVSSITSTDNYLTGFLYQTLGDLLHVIPDETLKSVDFNNIIPIEREKQSLYQAFLFYRFHQDHSSLIKKKFPGLNEVSNEVLIKSIAKKLPHGKPQLCQLIFFYFWTSGTKKIFRLFWEEVKKIFLSEECANRKGSLFDFLFMSILCPKAVRNIQRFQIIWTNDLVTCLHETLSNSHKISHQICCNKMQILRSVMNENKPQKQFTAQEDDRDYYSSIAEHIFSTLINLNDIVVDKNLPSSAKFLPTLLPLLSMNNPLVVDYAKKIISTTSNYIELDETSLQHLTSIACLCFFSSTSATTTTSCQDILFTILDVLLVVYLQHNSLDNDDELVNRNGFNIDNDNQQENNNDNFIFRVLCHLCHYRMAKQMQDTCNGLTYELIMKHLIQKCISWCKKHKKKQNRLKVLLKNLKISRQFYENEETISSTTDKEMASINSAFGLLHSHLCLHWLGGENNIEPLLNDIVECHQRLMDSLKSTKKSKKQKSNELPWMNVLTDALLVLLGNPSQILRRTVILVYQRLINYVNLDSVQIIIDRLFTKVEEELNDEEEDEDEEGEDEEMDKDDKTTESTNSDESSDEEEEEQQQEDDVNKESLEKARNLMKSALGSTALEDDTVGGEMSESDLGDDAMFAINDKLAQAVAALQKQNLKRKMNQQRLRLVEQKMRYLDLIDILAKESSNAQVLCALLKSIVKLLGDYFQTELHPRIKKTLRTMKDRHLTIEENPQVAKELVSTCVGDLLATNLKGSNLPCLCEALQILHRHISKEGLISALTQQIQLLFTKKFKADTFVGLSYYFERVPNDLWSMRSLLLRYAADNDLKPYQRQQAFHLLSLLTKHTSSKDCTLSKEDPQFYSQLLTLAFAVFKEFVQLKKQVSLCEKSIVCCINSVQCQKSLVESVNSAELEELLSSPFLTQQLKKLLNQLKRLKEKNKKASEMEVVFVKTTNSRKRKRENDVVSSSVNKVEDDHMETNLA